VIGPSPDAFTASAYAVSPIDDKLEEKRLAASLAHNVNNALTGVIGNLELALRVVQPESSVSDHLTRGLQGAYQIADLIHRIVQFALRTARAPSQEHLSLRRAALLAAATCDSVARGNGVQVALEGDSQACVMGDGRLLQNVLDQLIVNALDAVPNGGRVTIRVWEEAGMGRIGVCDSGPGFSSEARNRLFEPFFSTKSGGHLGLGLVICKEILESQHGSIYVTSSSEVGTVVTLALPLADAPARESDERELKVHPEAPQPGYREPHLSLAAIETPRLSNA
jgi:signal transduction histidine kinase